MPTSLPVPSKGALRALRNLALGTSCTVAAGAGVLTEDRRRRIHAARQVYDNAQTLKSFKSSRGFHGAVAIESFEEQLSQHGEDSFWLPSNVARYRNRGSPVEHEGSRVAGDVQMQQGDGSEGTKQTAKAVAPQPSISAVRSTTPTLQLKQTISATAQPLVKLDATTSLINTSTDAKLSALMDLEEPHVQQLQSIVKKIRTPSKANSGKQFELNETLLKDVVDLFLARTAQTTIDTPHSNQMLKIGQRLCQDTFLAKRYELTELVFERLEAGRGRRKTTAIAYLIRAQHAQGKHRESLFTYNRYHDQMAWHQTAFYEVGTCMVDGLLQVEDGEAIKSFLIVAAETARKHNLQMSSTWFLKTLGHIHRKYQDIALTQQTFEEFLLLISRVSHPHAIYSAIMQFCIECDMDEAAEGYYNRLLEAYPMSWEDVHISGHLIWMKARRGDWQGVKIDLTELHYKNRTRSPYQQEKFDSIFIPIMQAHIKGHDTTASEAFLMSILDTCHLRVTTSLSNLMISMYVMRGDIDPLLRWMEFASEHEVNIGPVTINTLLCKLARNNQISFGEIVRLYNSFRNLGRRLHLKMVDASTFSHLEDLAVQMGRSRGEKLQNLSSISGTKMPVAMDKYEVSIPQQVEKDLWKMHEMREFGQCLFEYKAQLQSGLKPTPGMLRLAVSAQLSIEGDHLYEAKELLQTAQAQGTETSEGISVLMVHWIQQLQDQQHEPTYIAERMFGEIRALSEAGISASQTTLRQTVNLLVQHAKYQAAVDFWQATCRHLEQSPSKVNLMLLTCLLKAYIGLRNGCGVRWCLGMLGENNLFPDAKFHHVLKQERNRVRKNLQGPCEQGYQQSVYDSCDESQRLRAVLAAQKRTTLSKTYEAVEKSARSQVARQNSAKVEVVQYQVQGKDPEVEQSDVSDDDDTSYRQFQTALG